MYPFLGSLGRQFTPLTTPTLSGYHVVAVLKALSVILNSKLHFFLSPQIFLHIQRELHCNELPMQQFSRKHPIFWKRSQFFLVGN